jgi:hypothetical protein
VVGGEFVEADLVEQFGGGSENAFDGLLSAPPGGSSARLEGWMFGQDGSFCK